MRLLLDTHALLWWLFRLPHLGQRAAAAIEDPSSDVHVSAVSAAEIEIKRAIGKMDAPSDLDVQVKQDGFVDLPFTIRHGIALRDLAMHHRDPFDRMLIAQARAEGLTLVTSDRAMRAYDVPIMSASE